MLRWTSVITMAALLGCKEPPDFSGPIYELYEDPGYGVGGSLSLTLPFPSGEYWIMTQGYEQGSHVNYGFTYGNDSFALDYTQSGCNAYGKYVTPLEDGTVLEANAENSSGDHGYGNNILIDHGSGYVSRYAHLSEILIDAGDRVDTHTLIGKVGDTGYVVGSACSSHPGTHLHVALYSDGKAIPPEPMSGIWDIDENCWYNREGDKDCSGDPGAYENDDDHQNSSDEEDGGAVNIRMLELSPPHGTANETEFIWASVVDSHEKPDVDLIIHNPNDNVDYSFHMETLSMESPWVFTYRKTLSTSGINYRYWVEAEANGDEDHSGEDRITVDGSGNDEPEFIYVDVSPGSGEAGEDEFTWEGVLYSHDEPEVQLCVVNAGDATLYRFDMEEYDTGGEWYARYEKTLRDPAVYTWWLEAENRETWSTSSVEKVTVQ